MFFNYEDEKVDFVFLSFLSFFSFFFFGNDVQILRVDGTVKNKSCLLASTGAHHADEYI